MTRALPFEQGRFDLVALITTLEFVADPVEVLREAMRVARLGLLLGVLNRSSLLDALRRVRGQHPVGVLAQAHRFRVAELARWVRQAAGTRAVHLSLAERALPWTVPTLGDAAALGRVPGDGRPSRAS